MLRFIVAGVAIVGGGLVLLFRNEKDDSEVVPENNQANDEKTSVSSFDADKVRQARRELRFQMRQKKKLDLHKKNNPNNGEEE